MSGEAADRVDYYFIYGPDADQIIGRYRELTGEVPLFGQAGPMDFGNARTSISRKRRLRVSRQKYRDAAYSGGQHRAGLVLVDHDGRDEVQLQLSRSARHD